MAEATATTDEGESWPTAGNPRTSLIGAVANAEQLVGRVAISMKLGWRT
jgi:hypothetical protein